MRLGFCRACGHVFNLAFNSALMEYSQAYENSLHFSPRFQRYAESLAVRLVERYDLHGKDIIEIGCGKGDFLILLCKLGDNRGIGFDRSYVPDPDTHMVTGQVTFVQDFYSERYADCRADLICCRHVLEHIQSPRDFVSSVRRSIGRRTDTIVFFEVPNALFTLRDLGVWDLIYEHCSYFGPSSLARLFALCGFDVCDLAETYAGQFLCLEAVPREGIADLTAGPCGDLEGMSAHVAAFADQYRRKVETWERRLEQMAQAGRRVVVWGAGSKGVSFLNTLKIREQVEYVVDVNPRKHGMVVAGTGQGIVPPEFLRDYQPEVIVVMNAVYETEIRRLVESLGLVPEILCA
jgi:SAM-dependent methyltransferase